MVSSYSTRFLTGLALFPALIFALFPACAVWQTPNGNSSGANTFAPEELRAETPFSNREPDVFQAEIVVTFNSTERKTFIARNGLKRRYDYDFGTKNQLTAIMADKSYLLLTVRKVFAEAVETESSQAADDWEDFLTASRLSAKTGAKFDKLETEGNLTRYRAAPDGNNLSEILISVDETLGLPVKQEFYSVSGGAKTLAFAVELKNLKLEAEESLFVVPKDFKKIPAGELRLMLRSGED